MLLLALFACDPNTNLNAAKPVLAVTPASADFGEVVVDNMGRLGLTVRNDGYGDLTFDSVAFDSASSLDFSVTDAPTTLGHDEEAVLGLQYVPDAEGEDFGTVEMISNDSVAPTFDIPVEGMGCIPQIDLDPDRLYFGQVAPGESYTLTTQVTAAGSCKLKVTNIAFSGDEAVAYSLTLPEGYETPYPTEHGFSFPIAITFTPPDTGEYSGSLYIESNDPEDPIAEVQLFGNTTDDPTTPSAPDVQILSPNNGEYFLDDEEVAMTGYVHDADEAATNLLCGWFEGSTRVATADVDSAGNVTGLGTLAAGDPAELKLRCIDSDGLSGEDSVELSVFPADEPIKYTITGGDSIFDYFSVDDDLTITLNGVNIYADTDHTQTSLPPFEFEANRGDVIGIVASDQNYCAMAIDALVLHWGTGVSQPLNDAMCDSACPEDACYSGTYNGPWPGVYLDETYTITIP